MSMRSPSGFIRPGFDPLKNPDAPTIGTATGGDAELSVTFTAPAEVGGSAITSYLATARKTSDGTLTGVSGASSPIVVTGLTNGDAYTATVAAINSYGPSAASEASNSVTPAVPGPSVIGEAFGGGFYAGQIGVNSVATHYIIVGPVASAQNSSIKWKNAGTATTGATSDIDGPQNTADIVADGSATVYPAGHFCNNLTIGGFSDWYMPARNELEICYYNLKPTTVANSTSSGINPNAVPARASNYTTGTPAQTSATDFQSTGAEDFTNGTYWSSTKATGGIVASHAMYQSFPYGTQSAGYKPNSYRVRAIRRIAA
jgi:hypothetical protein